MDRYTMYVDPATGQVTPATNEQIENKKAQILYIAGIEAVIPPPVWVGPYDGEMLFLPSKFESEDGSAALNITIGNITLTAIANLNFLRYEIHYHHNGEMKVKEVDKLNVELAALSLL
jgi:hypothetical protein